MDKIVRGSRISLQDQILLAIVKEIDDGRLRAGERLPPERRLAELVGASLAPVRAALKQLELAGYITRAQGRGTFFDGSSRVSFQPGDLLFVAAGVPHRFEDFSDDLAVWVMFYGPEGGESKG